MNARIIQAGLTGVLCLVLTGCITFTKSVPGPGDGSIRATRACGPELAQNGCEPDVGWGYPLDERSFNLEMVNLPDESYPNVFRYLGTLVGPDDIRSGREGVSCGSAQPPFTADHVLGLTRGSPRTFGREVEVTSTIENVNGASLRAELENALLMARVPADIVERLSAELNATVENTRTSEFMARGDFIQYQLSSDILNQLDYASAPEAFSNCVDMLQSGDWVMYQAITGWYVHEATVSTEGVNTITAGLVASLQTLANEDVGIDAQTVAAARASLNRTVSDTLQSADEPRFKVIGVSFWEPRLLQGYPEF